MANDPKYRVVFKAEDIISAQRMRFLRSSKFKILVGVWAAAALWSMGALLLPGVIPPVPYVRAETVLGTALIFALVAALVYWLAPLAEFRANPVWKSPFHMQVTDEHLMILLEGRSKGVFIRWEEIRNAHANDRAYILYTRSEDNFLILPRSVFPDAAAEGRFRALLRTRSSLKPRDKEKLAV